MARVTAAFGVRIGMLMMLSAVSRTDAGEPWSRVGTRGMDAERGTQDVAQNSSACCLTLKEFQAWSSRRKPARALRTSAGKRPDRGAADPRIDHTDAPARCRALRASPASAYFPLRRTDRPDRPAGSPKALRQGAAGPGGYVHPRRRSGAPASLVWPERRSH